MKKRTEIFDVVVDDKPVTVTATPYTMHTNETRYRVSMNGSPVYIFGWQDDLQRFTIIQSGRAAGDIPEQMDEAIGSYLYSRMAA